MEISQYVILNEAYINDDYKENQRIKRRPPALESLCGLKPIIWVDHKNKKIGFAAKETASTYRGEAYRFKYLAQLFDFDEIKRIYIGNVFPAKGSGYANLKLDLKGQKYPYTIFIAGCQDFDAFAEQIETITGKKVEWLTDGNDC